MCYEAASPSVQSILQLHSDCDAVLVRDMRMNEAKIDWSRLD